MNDPRDKQLGDTLAQIEIFEHDDGYWDNVSASVEPELERLRQDEGERPRRSDGPRPRRRRHVRRWAVAAVAAAAVAAVVTIGLAGVPGLDKTGPAQATAAQRMLLKISAALAETRTVRGDIVQRTTITSPTGETSWAEWRGSFAADASGSYRCEIGLGDRSDNVVVDGSGLSWGSEDNPGFPLTVNEPTHDISMLDAPDLSWSFATWSDAGRPAGPDTLLPGWPYGVKVKGWPTYESDFTYDRYAFWRATMTQAAVVRAAVAGNADLPVRDVTYDGRPAWEATIDFNRWATGLVRRDPPRVNQEVVTVDKATGFIVRRVRTYDASNVPTDALIYDPDPLTIDYRVTNLETDVALPPETFTALPAQSGKVEDVGSSDKIPLLTYRTLTEAAKAKGFTPPEPQPLPDGFALSVTGDSGQIVAGTGTGIMADPGLVALSPGAYPRLTEIDTLYRRGFDTFSVNVAHAERPLTGEVRAKLTDWADMLPNRQKHVLTGGALAGETAYTWVDFRDSSKSTRLLGTWVDTGVLVITNDDIVLIKGTITTGEMLQIANSLKKSHE